MTEFTVNPTRFDPCKNFKFRVKWDGKYVAGVSRASPLVRRTEVILHREGGDPSTSRKSPGRTEFDAITLERGITHDPAFEDWANKVWKPGASNPETALADFRKDIVLEICNVLYRKRSASGSGSQSGIGDRLIKADCDCGSDADSDSVADPEKALGGSVMEYGYIKEAKR